MSYAWLDILLPGSEITGLDTLGSNHEIHLKKRVAGRSELGDLLDLRTDENVKNAFGRDGVPRVESGSLCTAGQHQQSVEDVVFVHGQDELALQVRVRQLGNAAETCRDRVADGEQVAEQVQTHADDASHQTRSLVLLGCEVGKQEIAHDHSKHIVLLVEGLAA